MLRLCHELRGRRGGVLFIPKKSRYRLADELVTSAGVKHFGARIAVRDATLRIQQKEGVFGCVLDQRAEDFAIELVFDRIWHCFTGTRREDRLVRRNCRQEQLRLGFSIG